MTVNNFAALSDCTTGASDAMMARHKAIDSCGSLFRFYFGDVVTVILCFLYEPHREKTGFLHMRKQRRRSASR